MRALFLAVALVALASPASAQEAKLAVLPTVVEKTAEGAVPELFDDYLLTAVQEVSRAPVIGQDDIDAMLGFERTKELVGCDDVACMADIGGALGVDRLVHVKIAKLDTGDWVVTTKLINARGPTVEARTSDFVSGDTKTLLQAVPGIVRKLFAGGGMSAPAPAATPAAPALSRVEQVEYVGSTYDESFGGGARVGGVVLALIGTAAGIAGAAVATAGVAGVNADLEAGACAPPNDTDACYDGHRGEYIQATGIGVGIAGAGMALIGLGQNIYLNGKARAYAADDAAKGYHSLTWLGWLCAGVAVTGPMLDSAVSLEPLGTITGIGGLIGAVSVFTYTMMSSSATYRTSTGARYPMARLFLLRDRERQAVPAFGFALDL